MKLLTATSAKAVKGLKYNVTNYILYMSPHTLNSYGKNLCPASTEGCRSVCLYGSGRGVFNKVQKSRIEKSDLFISNLDKFKDLLYKELKLIEKRHKKNNTKFCVRLNGTSDIMFENIRYYEYSDKFNYEKAPNIFELFPNIQFIDYTKILGRHRKQLPPNYTLIFSFDGEKCKEYISILEKGFPVAVVFKDKLQKTLAGYKVIDGDETDLRHLDRELFNIPKNKGYIVGLTYKKNRLNKSANNLDNNNFIYDSKKHRFKDKRTFF